MGCRRRAGRVVCRRDFGSVCSRWGQYVFESPVQTTIALLTLGLKTRFFDTNEPVDHANVCPEHVVGWHKLVVSQGRSRPCPSERSTESCTSKIKQSAGFVSLHAEYICVALESCTELTEQQKLHKGKQRASPKLHPRRLGSAWKRLSSKNNIVTVEAAETDFLRLISAFPPQHIFLLPPQNKIQMVSWKTWGFQNP